jgi:hypothetical protein
MSPLVARLALSVRSVDSLLRIRESTLFVPKLHLISKKVPLELPIRSPRSEFEIVFQVMSAHFLRADEVSRVMDFHFEEREHLAEQKGREKVWLDAKYHPFVSTVFSVLNDCKVFAAFCRGPHAQPFRRESRDHCLALAMGIDEFILISKPSFWRHRQTPLLTLSQAKFFLSYAPPSKCMIAHEDLRFIFFR